jgi:hypothetical protein
LCSKATDFPIGAVVSAILILSAAAFAFPSEANPLIVVITIVSGILIVSLGKLTCAIMEANEDVQCAPKYCATDNNKNNEYCKEPLGPQHNTGRETNNEANDKNNARGNNNSWRCAGNCLRKIVSALKSVDSLITAIATALLTIVTIGLVVVATWQWTAMKQGQRPWIAMSGIAPVPFGERIPNWSIYYGYQFAVHNGGQSPALNVSVSVEKWNVNVGAIKFPTQKCVPSCILNNFEFLPGQNWAGRVPQYIEEPPLPAVGDDIAIVARIDYEDTDGNPHKTGICIIGQFDITTIYSHWTACKEPQSNYAD